MQAADAHVQVPMGWCHWIDADANWEITFIYSEDRCAAYFGNWTPARDPGFMQRPIDLPLSIEEAWNEYDPTFEIRGWPLVADKRTQMSVLTRLILMRKAAAETLRPGDVITMASTYQINPPTSDPTDTTTIRIEPENLHFK